MAKRRVVPVIVMTNIKNHKVYNTMEFVVEDIGKVEINEFAESFIPSFYITVYTYHNVFSLREWIKGNFINQYQEH